MTWTLVGQVTVLTLLSLFAVAFVTALIRSIRKGK